MRIISGAYRGLKLAEFSEGGIRPTSDRVKESLFNILGADVLNAAACDLFCGSGNLGIECLSRGARVVYFNDCSRESLKVLNKNLARLKGEPKYKITCLDYAEFLQSAKEKFDLILIDPPYREEFGVKALKIIADKKLLAPEGVAVYERDRPFEGEVEGLIKYDERKYGKTWLSFFKGE